MINEETVKAVWAKTEPAGIEHKFKKDFAGAWMDRDEYGNTNSSYGWEIDHAYPEAKGGSDALNNLQAMQWENNRAKGHDYPGFKTCVSSNGMTNVEHTQGWTYKKKQSV